MSDRIPLGIIGGSGVYEIDGIEKREEHIIETPFGPPSAPILTGELEGDPVAFLARHGLGHVLSPSEINYRANIYALKLLGVEQVLAISGCGSLRDDYAPGDIVVPDQIFDWTKDRKRTFFEDGITVHVSTANPFCPDLSASLTTAIEGQGGCVHHGGTYVAVEGPRFSTRAESNVFRAWGISVIGMTMSPEAFLAREAELCYTAMAHVTDFDVWHQTEESVTVEMVIRTLHRNTELAIESIRAMLREGVGRTDCTCGEALRDALITQKDAISLTTRERLALFLDRYLE